MEAKDGGSFAAAPSPVDGLGNYKGVMLCNRPTDEAPTRTQGGNDGQNLAFKPVSAYWREPLGLTPCKKLETRSAVKNRGPSAALRRHVEWIKELQEQVADEGQRVVEDEQRQLAKQKELQAMFKEQRDKIRELKSQGDQVNPRHLMALMEETSGLGKTKDAKKGKSQAKKPFWAMSEKEKEDTEEADAQDLIDFAEGLDFEKYLGDVEFRQCLRVVQDRARVIQKEQERFKDDLVKEFNAGEDEYGSLYSESPRGSQLGGDGGSQAGESRRRRGVDPSGGSRPDWDASTTAGDDRPVDKDARSDAARAMDANPALKGVHSKESVQRIIEKARNSGPPSVAGDA